MLGQGEANDHWQPHSPGRFHHVLNEAYETHLEDLFDILHCGLQIEMTYLQKIHKYTDKCCLLPIYSYRHQFFLNSFYFLSGSASTSSNDATEISKLSHLAIRRDELMNNLCRCVDLIWILKTWFLGVQAAFFFSPLHNSCFIPFSFKFQRFLEILNLISIK